MLTTFSGTVGGQLRQVSLYIEKNLCVKLDNYQESMQIKELFTLAWSTKEKLLILV